MAPERGERGGRHLVDLIRHRRGNEQDGGRHPCRRAKTSPGSPRSILSLQPASFAVSASTSRPQGAVFFFTKKTRPFTMQNKLLLVVLAGAAIALAGSWRRAGSVALLSLADPTGPLSDEEVAAFIFSFFCDAVLGSVA